MILKLWQGGDWDSTHYDLVLTGAFEELRGNWYKLSARTDDPELVVHRRQLLLIMKLAIVHCEEHSSNLL